MEIKAGFNDKPLKIKIFARPEYRNAEVWIEQQCPDRNTLDGRDETLSYATLEELLDLRDELMQVIEEIILKTKQ